MISTYRRQGPGRGYAKQRHGPGMSLAGAKQRLTIIHLWEHFGFPGRPSTSCRSPFREDHKPSFSVSPDGRLYHDFATGEAGDAVAFYQRATGRADAQSFRDFITLAGGGLVWRPAAPRPTVPRPVAAVPGPCAHWPTLVPGSAADLAALAALRGIPEAGLAGAAQRGVLWFATWRGCPSWVVTDSARVNAQARRMDGALWEHINAKSWTLPGSRAAWPLGLPEAKDARTIALCEGGPDLLAAHYLTLWEQGNGGCAPVGMMGAALRIPEEALAGFAGKHVRIFAHADKEGAAAMERWAGQLAPGCSRVDAFSFAGLRQRAGKPVKDLNEAIDLDAASLERAGRMMP